MGRVEYSWITLNDGIYTDAISQRLGEVFEILVNDAHLDGGRAAECFLLSGLARELEVQNPAFFLGKSGLELAIIAAAAVGEDLSWLEVPVSGWSAEYWAGRTMALFQIDTGCPYRALLERMPFEEICDLFYTYEESSPEEVRDVIKGVLAQRRPAPNRLKELRTAAGLTQLELAEKAGTSARNIQQYEQGVININRAAAGMVYRMSLVLHCRMEDLLDPLAL